MAVTAELEQRTRQVGWAAVVLMVTGVVHVSTGGFDWLDARIGLVLFLLALAWWASVAARRAPVAAVVAPLAAAAGLVAVQLLGSQPAASPGTGRDWSVREEQWTR